ncbi:MAG TPA: peptidylprolyl isomerase, partial [Parvularculaceae bacterium]|nr:peptidylprolyl isomerase [Parvularculaceae bacterium]
MLRQVRGALKSVVAASVSLLLVLAFAAWGVPEMRQFVQRAPLTVGRVAFSAQTIQAEYNRQLNQRRQQAGGKLSNEEALAAGLPDQVIDSIITRSALEQEALKMGLAAPTKMVRDYLQSIDQFKNPVTGKFDEGTLRNILANNNLSATQFESLIKEDLLRSQLIDSIAAGPSVAKPFTNALILREIERRKVGYLTITADMAGKPAEPTPDVLDAYYKAHEQAFMAPEYRTFTVFEVKTADFAKDFAAPEDELRKLYEANKERLYQTPEKRTLYQFNYADEASAQAAADALRKGEAAEKIAADKHMALTEATFPDITKDAVLDKSVAEAAFSDSLPAGGIAGPINGIF